MSASSFCYQIRIHATNNSKNFFQTPTMCRFLQEKLHLAEAVARSCFVFSCEFCEFFKNTYLVEHLRKAASNRGFFSRTVLNI